MRVYGLFKSWSWWFHTSRRTTKQKKKFNKRAELPNQFHQTPPKQRLQKWAETEVFSAAFRSQGFHLEKLLRGRILQLRICFSKSSTFVFGLVGGRVNRSPSGERQPSTLQNRGWAVGPVRRCCVLRRSSALNKPPWEERKLWQTTRITLRKKSFYRCLADRRNLTVEIHSLNSAS